MKACHGLRPSCITHCPTHPAKVGPTLLVKHVYTERVLLRVPQRPMVETFVANPPGTADPAHSDPSPRDVRKPWAPSMSGPSDGCGICLG